jgi:hypothetical protein
MALPCLSASSGRREAVLKLNPGLTLHLVREPFDPRMHAVKPCKVLGRLEVCLIDGRPVLGTDGEMPASKLSRAYVEVGGKTVALDVDCMYNPWFGDSPSPVRMFTTKEAEDGFFVRGSFSDGAGSYVAQWLVVDDSSVRTILSSDEALASFK